MVLFYFVGGCGSMNELINVIENIGKKILLKPDDKVLYRDYLGALKLIGDKRLSYKYSTVLRGYIRRGISSKSDILDDLYDLNNECLLYEARGLRFDSYLQYIEKDRELDKRFWLPRRQQLLPVVDSIQKLIDDELDILSISLPPGTGKSTLEIFLHTMMMGAFPDHHSLASGHSSTLTKSIYTGVLEIIQDDVEYRWRDIYPNITNIITNSKEQTIDLNMPHRFSTLTCRSIDGSLTGATRCNKLLTADDLVSGIEEALSIDRLNKLWDKYRNDLKSRKKIGCKELHLATRWSVHDPIGRLQRMYNDDERCEFLVVPAFDENGESNFDYKYRVGFDNKFLNDMKETLDDVSFRALYMNQPIEREGILYHPDELRRYFELPKEIEPDGVIGVCDTKDKGKDYAFLPVAYIYGDDYYIEDCVCDNGVGEGVEARLVDILLRHKVQQCRFESNSAGGRIAKDVQAQVKAHGGITHITTAYTTSNKETKIIVNSEWVKKHCLFKEHGSYAPKSDYGKMMSFLTSYTQTGRNINDDVPDGMAMLAVYVNNLLGSRVEVFKRPF